HQLLFKIIHSSTVLLPAWLATLKDHNLPIRMILCDVPTCWNSTFGVVEFFCEYQVAIEDITNKRKLGLTELTLHGHEWDLLLQLQDVLKDAMLFFSHGTPNLPMVILAMDYINEVFT
ncbi:hypothetical protein PISMIDRAFT_64311, partial [Pisolithus microcarpus 441]